MRMVEPVEIDDAGADALAIVTKVACSTRPRRRGGSACAPIPVIKGRLTDHWLVGRWRNRHDEFSERDRANRPRVGLIPS